MAERIVLAVGPGGGLLPEGRTVKRLALVSILAVLMSALTPPALARNAVSVEGSVVVINVPINFFTPPGQVRDLETGKRYSAEEYVAMIGEQAQAMWNDALARDRSRGRGRPT